MTGPLSKEELAAIDRVNTGLGAAFVAAGLIVLSQFVDDDAVSDRAFQLGIAQAHIDGLASALALFEPEQRDRLLDTLPAQIRQIMVRGKA